MNSQTFFYEPFSVFFFFQGKAQTATVFAASMEDAKKQIRNIGGAIL
jgi:hypothetical protein